MHCNVYPIFVKFVRLTHFNKELLTYLLFTLLAVAHFGRDPRSSDSLRGSRNFVCVW